VRAPALAADAAAAQALAKRSNCFKCHAIDKPKEVASWKEVAAKYKAKPDAQAKLTTHIATGPKVKLKDGSEEQHPVIKTKKEDEIRNLVDWILALPVAAPVDVAAAETLARQSRCLKCHTVDATRDAPAWKDVAV
jgi:cytochrome c